MRRLLLALPFTVLPLAMAQAAETAHASLGTHEHGVAQLDIAVDGTSVEIELDSPAMNIVGFEHAASTDADKAKVADARNLLLKSQSLFILPAAAKCSVVSQKLESPLFGDTADAEDEHDDHDHHDHAAAPAKGEASEEHPHHHSEIHAHYMFACEAPALLKGLDLAPTFKTFPGTHKIQVQLIAPSGQQGVDATPENARLTF